MSANCIGGVAGAVIGAGVIVLVTAGANALAATVFAVSLATGPIFYIAAAGGLGGAAVRSGVKFLVKEGLQLCGVTQETSALAGRIIGNIAGAVVFVVITGLVASVALGSIGAGMLFGAQALAAGCIIAAGLLAAIVIGVSASHCIQCCSPQ